MICLLENMENNPNYKDFRIIKEIAYMKKDFLILNVKLFLTENNYTNSFQYISLKNENVINVFKDAEKEALEKCLYELSLNFHEITQKEFLDLEKITGSKGIDKYDEIPNKNKKARFKTSEKPGLLINQIM